jgi:hypothetical protein
VALSVGNSPNDFSSRQCVHRFSVLGCRSLGGSSHGLKFMTAIVLAPARNGKVSVFFPVRKSPVLVQVFECRHPTPLPMPALRLEHDQLRGEDVTA